MRGGRKDEGTSLLRNSPIAILRGWIADEKPTYEDYSLCGHHIDQLI